MDVKKTLGLVLILTIVGSVFFIPIVSDSGKKFSTKVFKTDAEPDENETVTYGNLSESDKELFRDAMSQSFGSEGTLNTSADYVLLDGDVYQYAVIENVRPLETAFDAFLIVVGVFFIAASVGSLGSVYKKFFEEELITGKQLGLILLILSVVVGGLCVIFFGLPQVPTAVFIGEKVDTVSNNTTVLHVNKMMETNQVEFYTEAGDAPARVSFIEQQNFSDIDYIQSDGEYYPIEQKRTLVGYFSTSVGLLFYLAVGQFIFSFVVACVLSAVATLKEKNKASSSQKQK